jgi:hypothetical protein
MSYDSISGIPVVEPDNSNNINYTNNYGTGINLGLGMGLFNPMMVLFIVILILFIILLSGLGKREVSSVNSESGTSTNALTILVGGVALAVIILNASTYFFDMNLIASLKNLFTINPSLDLTIEQPKTAQDDAPVPEITEKKQVFHIPGNNYTYDNAKSLCKAYGSRLATYDEIEQSYDNGSEWCSYGWSDKQLALFPTQKETWKKLQTIAGHENDCGRTGINGGFIANPNVKFGANCFGYKPKITDTELDMMQNEPLYPKTMEDIREEEQVNYWKQKIPDILVSPFNKSVWSLV